MLAMCRNPHQLARNAKLWSPLPPVAVLYDRNGAAGGNRTLDTCLEGRGFTTKLQPQRFLAFVESGVGQAFALGNFSRLIIEVFLQDKDRKGVAGFFL